MQNKEAVDKNTTDALTADETRELEGVLRDYYETRFFEFEASRDYRSDRFCMFRARLASRIIRKYKPKSVLVIGAD